ncbi:MAG: hypothetical protein OEX04_19635 [Acidimicrobiia bacterium]|nr:hypothetical protein [Acidimicrobiia bacterium]MDH4309689.1 hypothetical protein [Acidimicrobiia bacterium]MDH5295469.1 hypothetical protein [Acidimicrobiia bacterium]
MMVFRRKWSLLVTAVFAGVAMIVPAGAAGGAANVDLDVSVTRAPVDPDGDLVGTPTDLVITYADLDPSVPGIGMKAGGTVDIVLPPEFVNTGRLPVAATGSAPDCAPPLVDGCSTAVFLQGWPQSPVLPFPDVTWDEDTNTVTMTVLADWLPTGVSQPGPKQVHLQLFGFDNPDRPGFYPIDIEIRPDPATTKVFTGTGMARITNTTKPNINPNSQGQGTPPPPFQNTMFQTLTAGDESLVMVFYLWDRDTNAYVGVDFPGGGATNRALFDAEGTRIGTVLVKAPNGADGWSLDSGGPATVANAIITGIPTGRLTAVLTTDPDTVGTYELDFRLNGGSEVVHRITTS